MADLAEPKAPGAHLMPSTYEDHATIDSCARLPGANPALFRTATKDEVYRQSGSSNHGRLTVEPVRTENPTPCRLLATATSWARRPWLNADSAALHGGLRAPGRIARRKRVQGPPSHVCRGPASEQHPRAIEVQCDHFTGVLPLDLLLAPNLGQFSALQTRHRWLRVPRIRVFGYWEQPCPQQALRRPDQGRASSGSNGWKTVRLGGSGYDHDVADLFTTGVDARVRGQLRGVPIDNYAGLCRRHPRDRIGMD